MVFGDTHSINSIPGKNLLTFFLGVTQIKTWLSFIGSLSNKSMHTFQVFSYNWFPG